ncbi:MAG: oxidoreductase, partial [Anaeromyxobacteraceae bacterium]
ALLLTVGLLLLWRRSRLRAPQPLAPTWGCAFARPTARMQYTGSSFADSLVLRFGWVFFPKTRVVLPSGPFPRHAAFDSSVPDTVLDVVIVPACGRGAHVAERVRAYFIGRVQFQALLVVLGLLTLLGWYATW